MGQAAELLREIKRFGLGEAAVHLAARAGLADSYQAYRRRVPYYESLSWEERRKELSAWYERNMGVPLDLDHPQTLTQWLQWSKLNAMDDHKTRLADKYAVREWVRETVGERYLIPLLGCWEHSADIEWDRLPEQFVLKANHGTRMIVIVKDKTRLNKKKAAGKLDMWLSAPFGWNGFELQYTPIARKILAEQYIEQRDGDLLDYKIHCFNGEPVLLQLIGGRSITDHREYEASYDTEWNRRMIPRTTYLVSENGFPRPENLDEMLDVARKLCAGFPYVRVDLYNVDGKVYFGEMTFTPANGLNRWFDEIFADRFEAVRAADRKAEP